MVNTTITFAGNLTADDKRRFTPNGTAVLEARVAVNRRVKDADQWRDAAPTFRNVRSGPRCRERP